MIKIGDMNVRMCLLVGSVPPKFHARRLGLMRQRHESDFGDASFESQPIRFA